jgi:hypothetical protein
LRAGDARAIKRPRADRRRVPAYPASHGSVRVPSPEAKIVYRFAKIDTVIVVR